MLIKRVLNEKEMTINYRHQVRYGYGDKPVKILPYFHLWDYNVAKADLRTLPYWPGKMTEGNTIDSVHGKKSKVLNSKWRLLGHLIAMAYKQGPEGQW